MEKNLSLHSVVQILQIFFYQNQLLLSNSSLVLLQKALGSTSPGNNKVGTFHVSTGISNYYNKELNVNPLLIKLYLYGLNLVRRLEIYVPVETKVGNMYYLNCVNFQMAIFA